MNLDGTYNCVNIVIAVPVQPVWRVMTSVVFSIMVYLFLQGEIIVIFLSVGHGYFFFSNNVMTDNIILWLNHGHFSSTKECFPPTQSCLFFFFFFSHVILRHRSWQLFFTVILRNQSLVTFSPFIFKQNITHMLTLLCQWARVDTLAPMSLM